MVKTKDALIEEYIKKYPKEEYGHECIAAFFEDGYEAAMDRAIELLRAKEYEHPDSLLDFGADYLLEVWDK